MRETQLKLVLYSHSPSTLTNTATGKTTQTFLTALVNNSLLLAVEVIAFMKIDNHFFSQSPDDGSFPVVSEKSAEYLLES